MNRQVAKNAKKGFAGIWWAVFLVTVSLLVSSCAIVHTPIRTRIALFAPFEGRYREVGYNALYAARLALADNSRAQVDLLAVDDGGTQAANHARALTQDPLVMAVVVLGYDTTTPETLSAFADIPVLVVSDWGAQPASNSVFILSNSEISQQVSVPPRISVTDAAALPAPVVGGEVFALEGFANLRESLDGVTILSSATLPDADFTQRYQGSDPFAPVPGPLATLTYDATMIAVRAAQSGSRGAGQDFIASTVFDGINCALRFENSYWQDAPIHRYHYLDSVLTDYIVK